MMDVCIHGVMVKTNIVADTFQQRISGWMDPTSGSKQVVALTTPGCSCDFHAHLGTYHMVICPLKEADRIYLKDGSGVGQVIRIAVGPTQGFSFYDFDPGDGHPGCWAHVRKDGALVLSKAALSYVKESKK